MSKKYENLQAEANELMELIGACNAELEQQENKTLSDIVWESTDLLGEIVDVLDTPIVSAAGKALAISSLGANAIPFLGQAAAAIGIATVAGGTAIGLGKRAIAIHKAKEAMLPYYEELTVKHMMLLEHHEALAMELMNLAQDELEKRQALMEDYLRQQALLKRIAESGLLQGEKA